MISVGISLFEAALRGGGAALTELEPIQAALAAGVVDGGLAASSYLLTINGGAAATETWEAALDGGTP